MWDARANQGAHSDCWPTHGKTREAIVKLPATRWTQRQQCAIRKLFGAIIDDPFCSAARWPWILNKRKRDGVAHAELMTACHNAVDFDEVMAFTSACRHEPQRPRAAQEMNFQVAVVAPTRITVKLSKFLSLPNPSQSSHLSGLWKWSMGVVMCYAYMYNIYIYTYMYIYIYHTSHTYCFFGYIHISTCGPP